MKLRTADLFSGCGGFSEGLSAVKGFSVEYAVDFWKPAGEIYKLNHKDVRFEFLDLAERANIEHVVETLSGNFDVLVGGPPCQGFSTLGKRRDGDARSTLVDIFAEIAVRSQPLIIIMENVRGIASKKHPSGGSFLESFCQKLRCPEYDGLSGYSIAHCELLATNFGMAQTRRRLFTIAIRKDVPSSESLLKEIWSRVESSQTKSHATLREALSGLEFDPPIFGTVNASDSAEINAHLAMNHSARLKERFSHIPAGGGLLDVPRHLLTPHLQKMVSGHYGSGGHVKNIYGRLLWDKPCGTIVAGMDKITCGRYVHPVSNRLLTPRECARIQSFSDEFKLIGGQVSRYYAVGNAVPPQLAQILGKAIEKIFKFKVSSVPRKSAA